MTRRQIREDSTRPAPAGLFLPVATPKHNTVIRLKAFVGDESRNPVSYRIVIHLGNIKALAGGRRVAAVILEAFPGHPTDHREPIHVDGELDDIEPTNPFPVKIVAKFDPWHFVSPHVSPARNA